MISKLVGFFLAILLVLAAPATSFASQWVATKVSKSVRYTQDNKTWVNIRRGMKIPNNSWIHTGRRGRLILRRGKEVIMYRPNTLAYLKSLAKGRRTHVQQEFGSLLLDVETRNRKHVTIKTPLLAAVVKGTRFEITVSKGKATVSVERGVVGVTSNKSGKSVNVTAGRTAGVSASRSGRVSLGVTKQSVSSKTPRAATNSAHGYSNNSSTPSESGNEGGGRGSSNGNANGNGNGNSNGNANGNGNGNSNGNANGNGNGNSNGNANGFGNGNSNGNGN